MAAPKGIEKRLFSTIPTRALLDVELTALDMRVLGFIALHDGMTLLKEAQGKTKGAGCTASNITLCREAQCSYAALCRSLSKLEKRGHIVKQDRRTGKQTTSMRVCYPVPDNVPTEAKLYDEPVISPPDVYDEPVISTPPVYDQTSNGDSQFAPDSCGLQSDDYSSLREELYVAKAKELNSPKGLGSQFDEFRSALPMEKKTRERELPSVSLRSHLPATFATLDCRAQVACLERAFNGIGRNADIIVEPERREYSSLLYGIGETYGQENFGYQAARLYEEIAI